MQYKTPYLPATPAVPGGPRWPTARASFFRRHTETDLKPDTGALEMETDGKESRSKAPCVYTKSRALASMCAVRAEPPSTIAFSSAEPAKPLTLLGQPAQKRNLFFFFFDPRAQIYITEGACRSTEPSHNSMELPSLRRRGGNAQRHRLCSSGSTRRPAGPPRPPKWITLGLRSRRRELQR